MTLIAWLRRRVNRAIKFQSVLEACASCIYNVDEPVSPTQLTAIIANIKSIIHSMAPLFLKFRTSKLVPSLDLVIPVLGCLRSITDTLSNYTLLPGVSAALGTVQEVAILIQNIQMDKEDAKDTLEFMEDILNIAQKASKAYASLSRVSTTSSAIDFEATVEIINTGMLGLCDTLKKETDIYQGKVWFKRALHQSRYRQALDRHKTKFDQSIKKLGFLLNIDIFSIVATNRLQPEQPATDNLHFEYPKGPKVLSSSDLDWGEVPDSRSPYIFRANYKAQTMNVLVVKYRKKEELDYVRERVKSNWGPYQPVLFGYSTETPFFLAVEDPGVPAHLYLQEKIKKAADFSEASIITLDLLSAMAKAVVHQFDPRFVGDQGCSFDEAFLYIRKGDEMPVLCDFSSVGHHKETESTRETLKDGAWNSFSCFSALILSNERGRPNYLEINHNNPTTRGLSIWRPLLQMIFSFPWLLSGTDAESIPDMRTIEALFKHLQRVLCRIKDMLFDQDCHSAKHGNSLSQIIADLYPSSYCGIWDAWCPLGARAGDIGYMENDTNSTVQRPRFTKLANVAADIIGSEGTRRVELNGPTCRPPDRWKIENISDTLIRYTVHLDITEKYVPQLLGFWRSRQEEKLSREGWNMTSAWEYMRSHRHVFEKLSQEKGISIDSLYLIFSVAGDLGHAILLFNPTRKVETGTEYITPWTSQATPQSEESLLSKIKTSGGVLYYFENLVAPEGSVHGYWSTSGTPVLDFWSKRSRQVADQIQGSLKDSWTLPTSPSPPGPNWGWSYSDEHFTIEISKKGSVEHIRYLTF